MAMTLIFFRVIHVVIWSLIVLFYLAVYSIYTSIVFHGSLLHVLFNMLALVPLGSELDRIIGSVRMLYITTLLLATSNAIFHLLIALLAAHNPFHPFQNLMDECKIGFSGIIFSLIVIETSLSGAQSRSNVAARKLFGIPLRGTHSHAFVSSFMSPDEIIEKSIKSSNGSYICEDFVSFVHTRLSKI